MTKFLPQSKSFLPMIIQKSAAETTIEILENKPPVTSTPLITVTDQVESGEIGRREENAREVVKRQLEKAEVVAGAGTQDHHPLSFYQAVSLDLSMAHTRMMLLLGRGRLWLEGRHQGLLRPLGNEEMSTRILWVESQPRRAVRLEDSDVRTDIRPEPSKKKTIPSKTSKSEREPPLSSPPFKSAFLQTVQERSPAWQKTIAVRLGELQRAVIRKLSQ